MPKIGECADHPQVPNFGTEEIVVLLVVALLPFIALVPLTGGSVRNFADLRLRWTPLLFGALALAVVVTTLFPAGDRDVHRALNYLAYLAAIVVLARNRAVPGLRTIAVGTVGNMVAIAANRGVMPASVSALRLAGLPVSDRGFLSSNVVAHPTLSMLGDIFAVPKWVPFANVFSIGDVLIVAGAAWAILAIGQSWLALPRLSRRPTRREKPTRAVEGEPTNTTLV